MGEAGATARNEIDVTRNVELADLHFLHPAVLDFPAHAHARDDGHAHAHLHEAFDAFDGGHFDGHVEGSTVAGEEFNDAAAKGRFDTVGDEGFGSEVSNVDFAFFSQGVSRLHDQGQLVFENYCGLELRIAGDKGDSAEIEAVVQDFVWNLAGQHAVNTDLDTRMKFAKFCESRKESVNGTFVYAEGKFAASKALEFGETFLDFVAEIDETLGVVSEKRARIS